MAKNEKCGALWKGKGKVEASGEFECPHCKERTKVVQFPNGYKDTDKHPDSILYVSKPQVKEAPEETTDIEPF